MANNDTNFQANQAELEGHISKIWSRQNGDVIFRLAVYDEYTELLGEKDRAGRDRRKPHFVTVVVPKGRVNNRPVDLCKGDHVRVVGHLRDETYFETLRDFLLKAKAEHLLASLPPDVSPLEIKSGRVATQIISSSLVHFTR